MTDTATTDSTTATSDSSTADTTATDQATGQMFSQSDLDRIVKERVARERQKYAGFDDLKAKAAEFDKLAEAQKTEAQKMADRLAEVERTAAEKDQALARMMAAATHKIPADLIDLLGSGTSEEIDARAQLLAEKLAANTTTTQTTAAATGRPVESLRPGAAPGGGTQNANDPNAWLRRAAGRN